MGYCMHFDSLLDRIIEARDLYLTKKGLIEKKAMIAFTGSATIFQYLKL
jgi:hypothetical protein